MDHMVAALAKTFKCPVVDTIQALPQHQQVSYITVDLLISGTSGSQILTCLHHASLAFVFQCDLKYGTYIFKTYSKSYREQILSQKET